MTDARKKGPEVTRAPSAWVEDDDGFAIPQTAVVKAAPSPRKRPVWVKPLRLVERRLCRACRVWTWQSWDADVCAGYAVVDAGTFLTAEGEERALTRGRRTWDYITVPRRRIEARDEWIRSGAPAGGLWHGHPVLVVVQHVHGRPAPQWARYTPPQPARKPRDPEQAPF